MDWDKTVSDNAGKENTKIQRSSLDGVCQLPSPEPSTTSERRSENSRKRKVSTDDEECSTAAKKQVQGVQTSLQNKSHSIVEKRYRTNLNQKITDLGDLLPNLRVDVKVKENAEKPEAMLKHNKATILNEAITYIQYLERRNTCLEQANTMLQEQSRKLMSEHVPVHEEMKAEVPTSSSSESAEFPVSPSEEDRKVLSKPIQGMIKVPEEWRRLWRGELKFPLTGPEVVVDDRAQNLPKVSVRGGKYMGKLIVGSLAGLMVADGYAAIQKEGSEDRGLFSLPLLRHLPNLPSVPIELHLSELASSLSSFPHSHLLAPLFRGFLVFGVLGLMLFIYLFNSRPPPRKPSSRPQPQPAPSLASPLEVRQRAWLTSIQTVWVPRHHVLPELLALNLETAAYLIRQLLGWHMYSWLTGRSEDEEIAKVRAWDIAIDAQLSGGDPEISKSRLVLTLWASGTLPSTPARLMLKALHIRVLFWQPSRFPWVTRLLHKAAQKLSRWQWDKAYRMQRKLEAAKVVEPEPLSEHLKALLTQDCDEVLSDIMIQRAHNLVWNTSVSDCLCSEELMEDTAMRGPLDALASWTSSLVLTATLKAVLACDKVIQDDCVLHQLRIGIATSPPGSLGKAKALAAKAILCGMEYNIHVRELVQTLAPSPLKEEDLVKTMSSAFVSLVRELPGTDGHDISASARSALAMGTLQNPGCSSGAASKALQLLNTFSIDATSMSLLGLTAARQLCLVLQQCEKTAQFSSVDFALKSKIHDLLHSLEDSAKVRQMTVDTETRDCVVSAFRRMLVNQGTNRRCSTASYDTGYDSMSDDKEVLCGID